MMSQWGGHYKDYLGSDFSTYDLVILLDGVDYDHQMPDSVQQGLRDYVFNGGVLLTTEWLLYYNNNQILDSIIPLHYEGTFSYNSETYITMEVHPITAGLPDTFVTKDTWSLLYMSDDTTSISTNRLVLFQGLEGGPAMGIGDYGTGKTIHWAMAGAYSGSIWSDEIYTILLNIASYSTTI